MALVRKYKTTYCDEYGRTCEVFILQEGYSGDVTELEAQTTPFTISYDSSTDFKYEPIRASSATLNLVMGGGQDMDEFWSQSEREYTMEHYIDSAIDWVGWIIPNGYTKQLTGGLYYAKLQATDALSNLDSRPFLHEPTGRPFGIDDISPFHDYYQFSLNYLLCECLRKTDLNLDYHVCVDVYEKSMTRDIDSRNAEPLTQSSVNVRTYIGDTTKADIPYWRDAGEVFNTLEVLENLCRMFSAKIYQQNGVWKFKRVNADIKYGTGADTRWFYRYDFDGDYIAGRLLNGKLHTIACMDETTALIEDNHQLTMDEVYKAYRVNYKFAYTRAGDDNVNLIENGGFSETWSNTTATSAPPEWIRWREGDKWYPRLQQKTVQLISGERAFNGQNEFVIEMGTGGVTSGTDPNAAVWAGLRYGETFSLNEGDELNLRFYAKFQPQTGGFYIQACMVHLEVTSYNLQDRYSASVKFGPNGEPVHNELSWFKLEGTKRLFIPCPLWRSEDRLSTDKDSYRWMEFYFRVDPLPITGNVTFTVHGIGGAKGYEGENFPAFPVNASRENTVWKVINTNWKDDGGVIERLQVTGFSLGIIANDSERDEFASYIATNIDTSYSLQKDPVEIYNGDTPNEYAISQITVSSQSNPRNEWEDIEGVFGTSSLGLVQAKSVMELYSKPNKILEGTVQAQDAEFGDVFIFDAIGTERFILQRGTFNRKMGYIEDATFTQISKGTPDVPDATGEEDGASTEAILENVGGYTDPQIRCEVDGNLENTGFAQILMIDTNLNSPTYNLTFWIYLGQDITRCPVSTEPLFYVGQGYQVWDQTANTYSWTAQEPINPYDFDDPDQWLEFRFYNSGGFYLYFVHHISRPDITGVASGIQDDIVTDWEYSANNWLNNGEEYRVFGMKYPTSDHISFIKFKF